ncbi:MAG: hypothetical protein ACFFEF_04460 [Candidatus Thorarchaeota archaeon]
MTIRTESITSFAEQKKCDCGRCSCIILYTSESCILCDAALEIMHYVITDFGLSANVIRRIDITTEDDFCNMPHPVSLPAMRICQELLTGIPDMDVARGAVMHAVLKGCFSEQSY